MAEVVVDASAMVDRLLDDELGGAGRRRLAGHALHAPAHVDVGVCSASGRLHRAGDIHAENVESELHHLSAAPLQRHAVGALLIGSWARRDQLRLVDALYVQLAVSLDLALVTTDRRLQAAPAVEVVVS